MAAGDSGQGLDQLSARSRLEQGDRSLGERDRVRLAEAPASARETHQRLTGVRHVAGSLEAGDCALERFDGLRQAAAFAGRHGPAQQDEREGGILLGRERLRPVEQVQRLGRVEAERALTGEQGVVGCTRRYLGLEGGIAGCLGEGERFAGVVGELLDLLAGLGFQPVRGCQVLCRTPRTRDLLVGDVSDEQVPEPVLRLALHRRLAGGPHELLACELVQRPLDLVRIAVAHGADRAGPEHLAQHGRVLEEGLALLGERVEAGRDQRVNRLRERHIRATSERAVLVEQVAVTQHPHELLGVQRVAARPVRGEAAASPPAVPSARAGRRRALRCPCRTAGRG